MEADIIVEIRGSVYALKRILRQSLTLKPILHNKSGTEKPRDPNVKIINADRGNPGFYCELTDCGKSTECTALETHFALGGDTQTVITQDNIQQRKVRIAL